MSVFPSNPYQIITLICSVALAITSVLSACASRKTANSSSDTLAEARRLNEVAVSPHCFLRFPYGQYSPKGEWNENIFDKLQVNNSQLTLNASVINCGPAPGFDVVLYLAKGVVGNPCYYTPLTKGIKISKVKMVTAENAGGNNIDLTIDHHQFANQALIVPSAKQVLDTCDTITLECRDIFGKQHKTVHKKDGSVLFNAVYNFTS